MKRTRLKLLENHLRLPSRCPLVSYTHFLPRLLLKTKIIAQVTCHVTQEIILLIKNKVFIIGLLSLSSEDKVLVYSY